MFVRVLLSALLFLSLFFGCTPDKSVREWLVEANHLVINGEIEGAQDIYERLYTNNPTHINVLLDLATFYVDNQKLEEASPLIDRLRGLELRDNELRRRLIIERSYLETVYELSRGDGPAAPAEEGVYEEALRGLINISSSRNGPELEEYTNYLLIRARRSIGGEDMIRLNSDDREGLVHRADAAHAREANGYIVRLFGDDEGLEFDPVLSEEIRLELETAQAVLKKTIFFDDFDTQWSAERRRFINEARFDPELEEIIEHYTGPLMDDLSSRTSIETLIGRAQTWYAREVATNLVYELRGLERSDGEFLPYRLRDFAEATVSDLTITPSDQIDFTTRIPFSTIRKGAWLLEERIRSAEESSTETQK